MIFMLSSSGAAIGGMMNRVNQYCKDQLERLGEYVHDLLTAKVGAPESKHCREFGGLLPRSESSLPHGAATE
jgi:hypothetical protein